ncbi:hypothetical protein MP228_004088 [Amoeboaphelidium protococcarum]|nr:hypothetical protein MP228_004088 [Amoeboaphelidium protococcarum]
MNGEIERKSSRLREIPKVEYNETKLIKQQQVQLEAVKQQEQSKKKRKSIKKKAKKQKDDGGNDGDVEAPQRNVVKKKGTHYSGVISKLPVPANYVYFNPGDPYMTRNVKKETLDSGKNFYEEIEWERNGMWKRTVAYHCPKSIYEQVKQKRDATQAKRRAAVQKKEESQRAQVWAIFDRMFPRLPEDKREQIYDWSFEKRSGRIGNVQHLPLDKRVLIAVRTHALHNMTDFEERYEDAKDALYEETVGQAQYTGFRDEAYYQFYAGKEELYEDIKDQCDREVDQIIANWR